MNCSSIWSTILGYDTVKYITVKNKKIGLLNRVIQVAILSYIIGFAIIYKKGYQEVSSIESATTTKVKGVIITNFSKDEFDDRISNWEIYNRAWDVPDYVIPPSENDAFFVATNVIMTPQIQSTCAEDPDVIGAGCEITNNTCQAGTILPLGNGQMTGSCVESFWGGENQTTCAIRGWCPIEEDFGPLISGGLLAANQNFTVLIKNFISFPLYKVNRRNVLDTSNTTYLNNCNYDPITDNQCPVFVLSDIVSHAGESYDEMAMKGGVIAITIDWTCNLDRSVELCIPTYSFKRLDEPNAKIAKGWNFRYANYYRDKSRTLYKVYGINFVIMVSGSGGKFNFIPLLLNVGSGVGLLAAASVICDLFVLYWVKKRDLYKSKKYTEIQTDCDGFKNTVNNLNAEPNIIDFNDEAGLIQNAQLNESTDNVATRRKINQASSSIAIEETKTEKSSLVKNSSPIQKQYDCL